MSTSLQITKASMDVLYHKLTVEGVDCIVSLGYDTEDGISNRQKRIRKKEKDEIGYNNKDKPLLDTMKSNGTRKYCDIIIYTDNILSWEAAIRQYYLKNTQATKKGFWRLSNYCGK